MEAPVTLVSCLFWLARTKWQHSGFPPNYDRYSSWSENFLSLDSCIVIFTDDHYYEHVLNTRKKYDPELSKTVIHKVALKDLEFYKKYFFKMSVLMASPQFRMIKHSDCADNMYPLYNVVQYNKISLLQQVSRENPFKSSHLMWMDVGSTRENSELYRNKAFPLNFDLINDKIIHFTHNYEFGYTVKQDYFLSQIRNIQGTSYIIPINLVDKYHNLISAELEETMASGFIGSDEKTYDSIYLKNKEIVHLVKCGWFQFYNVMAEDKPRLLEPPRMDAEEISNVATENVNFTESVEQVIHSRQQESVGLVFKDEKIERPEMIKELPQPAAAETEPVKKKHWWNFFGN